MDKNYIISYVLYLIITAILSYVAVLFKKIKEDKASHYNKMATIAAQQQEALKVYDALNGDCAILAVGGESTDTFISKLPILKHKFYRPSYVFLELMSNDTDFNTWKTNTETLIDWAESIGATPVLCMMQKTKMALAFYNSVLNYVINTKYIVINFYKGMTQNGDGVTNIDSLFLSDHIHPNQAGHARMFKQVQADIPEIFPLDYV